MSPAGARRVEAVILATIVLFGLLSVVSFRALLPLAAIATATLVWLLRGEPLFRDVLRSPVFWALSALLIAGGLSWFVTLDRSQTGPKILQLAAIFFTGLLMIAAFRRGAQHVDPGRLQRASLGAVALMVGGVLIAELLPGTLQDLGIHERYFSRGTDDVTSRAIALFAVFIFIFILVFQKKRALIFLFCCFYLFYLFYIQGVPFVPFVAFLCGAAISFVAVFRPRAAIMALSGFSILGLASFTWVMNTHAVSLETAIQRQINDRSDTALSQILRAASVEHRLQIWGSAASRIAERPWLGWGLDASRRVPATRETYAVYFERTTIDLHPHNGFLQIWLEMGAVGALAAVGVVIALTGAALRLAAMAPAAGPAIAGSATAALTIFGVSFGAFQSWWVGALFIMWAFAQVFIRTAPAGSSRSVDQAAAKPMADSMRP